MEEESPVVAEDPLVASVVSKLRYDDQATWIERASIMEFDGHLPRSHAEALAVIDLLHHHPAAISGISILKVELDGSTEYVVTTDRDYALKHLADIHATFIAEVQPHDVVAREYGGVAVLSTLG